MAGKAAARKGDTTVHGGLITSGCETVIIGNLPAARSGDGHSCPQAGHLGGTVQQASTTVFIGGMPAAREGDLCGCTMVGVSGAGVPAASGPGGAGGGNFEPVAIDTDGDGEADAWLLKGNLADASYKKKLGPLTIEAEGKGGLVDAKTDPHKGAKVEVGGGQGKINIYLGGDPDSGYAFQGDLLHGEAEADSFFLWDGDDRFGYKAHGKAGIAAIEGKQGKKTTLLELGGYSVELAGETGAGAASAGAEIGGWGYYDGEEGRAHMGGAVGLDAVLGGLGMKGDLTIGKVKAPEAGGGGGGGPAAPAPIPSSGLPNAILLGCTTVLIG